MTDVLELQSAEGKTKKSVLLLDIDLLLMVELFDFRETGLNNCKFFFYY